MSEGRASSFWLRGGGGVSLYFDRQGRPIDLSEFGRLAADRDYKVVAQTQVGSYLVSTVWLGIDHDFSRGVPVIFESMVFATVEGVPEWRDIDCVRYASEAEARVGHEELVTLVRATAVGPG